MLGVVVWDLKGSQATDMETEKQVFDRQMFAGWAEMVGHEEGSTRLCWSLPLHHWFNAAVVCADGPPPGQALCLHSLGSQGKVKVSS